MKDKIRAIIILIIFCVISLLTIVYDLYTTLHKQQEINENILYNSSEIDNVEKTADRDESEYTIEVKFEPIQYIEKKQEKKNREKKQYIETEEFGEAGSRIHIGRCRLTIYTPYETHYGYTTATGVRSEHLVTCAVDPKLIRYHSDVILIKSDGTEHRLKAVDCGNFKGRMIDVFYDGSVSDGVAWLIEMFGAEYADVYIEV